jgi:hypothetical protein
MKFECTTPSGPQLEVYNRIFWGHLGGSFVTQTARFTSVLHHVSSSRLEGC